MTPSPDFSSGAVFADFATAIFDPLPRPPESLARRVLGVAPDALLTVDLVNSSFRARLKELHPDVATEPPECLVDELQWARNALGALVRVTAAQTSPPVTSSSRNDSSATARPAPVTADDLRAQPKLTSRNRRILAEVEEHFRRRRDLAERHKWHRERWQFKSEPEWFTEFARDAHLICAGCHQPPRRRLFLEQWYEHRRVYCSRCARARLRNGETWLRPRTGTPRRCECGIVVVRVHDRYYPSRGGGYCSPSCERLAHNAALRDRRRVTRGTRACGVCGDTFEPRRSDARYCSPACRQDAYRKRKLGAQPAPEG